jgi:hypothetical protein
MQAVDQHMTLIRNAILIGIGFTSGTGAQVQMHDRPTHLVLTVQRTVALPDGSRIAGAAISPSGSLVLWARGLPGLFVIQENARARMCTSTVKAPIAGSFEDDSTIDVLDMAGPAAYVLNLAERRCTLAISLHVGQLLGGARSGGSWIVGDIGKAGAIEIGRVGRTGLVTHLVRSTGAAGDPFSLARAFARPLRRGVLLASVQWPFRWTALSMTGHVIRRSAGMLAPNARAVLPSPADSLINWLGLPVLALDQGYIQTIADPRSDRRIVVRYREDGSPVAAHALDVAMGFLASNPATHQLVALRRTNHTDLVIYHWHWAPGDSESK